MSLAHRMLARLRQFWMRHGAALVAGAAGLAYFVRVGGGNIANPFQFDWLVAADGLAHLMGWWFFRNEAWHLPLGSVRGLLYPTGTTIGFTDSIPWVGVVFKLLSPVLPPRFQYFSLWLALSFALQAFVAAKIIKVMSPSRVHQALGGAIYPVSAVLALRAGHESLSAHWILLICIWLHMQRFVDPVLARRLALYAIALNVFASGIHPYLELMVLPLTLALYLRLRIATALTTPKSLGYACATCVVAASALALFGYAGGDQIVESSGFGEFSADVSTLFNPIGYSNFLPSLPVGNRQYEGLGYLGAGVLGLGAFGCLGMLVRPRDALRGRWGAYLPLFLASIALALFAAATPVTWLGKPVLSLAALYAPLKKLTGPFRSSGRFVWPLHYVMITFAVGSALRVLRAYPRLAACSLALALAVQVADIQPSFATAYFRARPWKPLDSPAWSLVARPYRHVALYPPQIQWVCPTPFDESLVSRVGYAAYLSRMTFNSAYVARVSPGDYKHCAEFPKEIARGAFDAETVYVVSAAERVTFVGRGTLCGRIDELVVCVRSDRATPLTEYLSNHP